MWESCKYVWMYKFLFMVQPCIFVLHHLKSNVFDDTRFPKKKVKHGHSKDLHNGWALKCTKHYRKLLSKPQQKRSHPRHIWDLLYNYIFMDFKIYLPVKVFILGKSMTGTGKYHTYLQFRTFFKTLSLVFLYWFSTLFM